MGTGVPVPRDGRDEPMGRHRHDIGQPGRHHGRQADAVPVRDLLARAIRSGDALGLAWKDVDLDAGTGMVRPYVQSQFPTAVLPAVTAWPDDVDTGPAR
ncbi:MULTISPECIES: hypothetical protein [Actinoalloteichus]|uniref:Uncharacterized protein n=1 Tax=Actinoalloteichus fjordicus TaxID=1612552 RepID=A0AAC9PUK9_9PSEU|nr:MULTISPECIES: hypothetical protein [Actinoalloteichus]APU17794.1 hypothetical protein UA74_29005 [Actinoalloteichus fjordicus]APU23873.1 hypothetical protein UA75_29540 [Actinoalloteichus sp. GBA129-24]